MSGSTASKRRAKARKAGLQALLAGSKAHPGASSPGLTLSDFRKK
jgi:hypothetical protein